jgi:hypothetical protein
MGKPTLSESAHYLTTARETLDKGITSQRIGDLQRYRVLFQVAGEFHFLEDGEVDRVREQLEAVMEPYRVLNYRRAAQAAKEALHAELESIITEGAQIRGGLLAEP